MKIFSAGQIKEIDRYTVENEPVKSIDLMERASLQLLGWLTSQYKTDTHFVIFSGPGNNGGDGLALGRLLYERGYGVEIQYVEFTDKASEDWEINFQRLKKNRNTLFHRITSAEQFPLIAHDDVIIDAIFGSGLSRPVSGLAGEVIRKINLTGNKIISVDIPSGLFTEDNRLNNPGNIIRADYTLTFQSPKLAFLFAENYLITGEWHILPIGLSPVKINETVTPYFLVEKSDVKPFIKKRHKFDHKGKFGHGLLITGSKGKLGASVLSSKAALRTGIGLLTCHLPGAGAVVLHSSIAEAMTSSDENENFITSLPDIGGYNAIGIGPGIGTDKSTAVVLKKLLSECKVPLVLDADAINILGANRKMFSQLPEYTILTPHPKEFERIAGKSIDSYDRLQRQILFSASYKCILVLKGAYTSVSFPDGRVFFNSTGNPGMATAGSGDVLTGMILSLLAQGYSPENASVTGVFLHGLAGDLAIRKSCYESLIASDIIENIAGAYNILKEKNV